MGCCPSNSKIDPLTGSTVFEAQNPISKEQKSSNPKPEEKPKLANEFTESSSKMLVAPSVKKGSVEKELEDNEDDNRKMSEQAEITAEQNDETDEPDNAEEIDENGEVKLKDLDTIEKIKEYTNQKVTEVKNGDPETENLERPLERLSLLYKNLSKRKNGQKQIFCDYLAELNVVQIAVKFMETPREDYFEAPLHRNISTILTLLWNATDLNVNISLQVCKDGLHRAIVNDFRKPVLQVENLKDANGKQLTKPINRVKALFAILYNSVRNCPDSKFDMRKEGVVEICMPFMTTKLLNVKAKALLALTYVADLEQSAEIIQATEANIRFIVLQLLEGALNTPSHRGTKYGYTVEELTESMSRLAINRNNALEMVKLNVFHHCNWVLNKKFSEGEIRWTLELLWSLSFIEETHQIMKEKGLDELIQEFTTHEKFDISRPAKGVLWELGVEKSSKEKLDFDDEEETYDEIKCDEEKHIMISYCWKQQPRALQIFEKLKENGKKVWMDIERMEGDSLEKMAEAVEKSAYIICCFSEDYSNSQACRSEATYAYKQKKKLVFAKMQPDFEPKGWLGLILGAEIYYQLFDEEEFKKQFPKMMSYMNSNEPLVSNTDHSQAQSKPPTKANPPAEQKYSELKKSEVSSWSEQKVKQWISSMGLTCEQSLQEVLVGMKGEELAELSVWQKTASGFFLEFCKESLKFSNPLDMLKFSAAVRKLK